MPTENRSSNTEMVSVPFVREDRYIVIKRSDLMKVPVNYRSALVDPMLSLLSHLPRRECLVIESDWPEFEPAWSAIEARVTGKPAQQPHPEPIAWMVGTAFWWTKEEAERDAQSTGLPMVGLGPMTDSSTVERLSAACAANIRARDEAIAEGRRYMGQASALDAALREARRCVAEGADPETGGPTQREAQVILGKIDAALSASAEPNDECAHSYANSQGCPECGESFAGPIEHTEIGHDALVAAVCVLRSHGLGNLSAAVEEARAALERKPS